MGPGLTCLPRWVGHMDLQWIWTGWEMDTVGVVVEEEEIGDEGDLTAAVHLIAVIETVDIADLAATAGLAPVLTVVAGTAMTDIVGGMTMIVGGTTTIGAEDLLAVTVVEVGAVLVSVMVQVLLHAGQVTKRAIYLTCHQVEEAGAGAQMTTVSWTGPLPKREKVKSRVVGAAEAGAGIVVVVAANEARVVGVERNLRSVSEVEAGRGIN